MSPTETVRESVLRMQRFGYESPYRLTARQETLEAIGDIGEIAKSMGVAIAVECDDEFPANIITLKPETITPLAPSSPALPGQG